MRAEPRAAGHGPKLGLILAGGGARAAYQVGVLKAIAEMLSAQARNPFPIICGTSAGAINAATLAIYARRFHEGVRRLVRVWSNFHVDHVFRVDPRGVLSSAARWYGALLLGGLGKFNPAFLLDRAPLHDLLRAYLPMEEIQAAIDAGALQAVSVTSFSYTADQSVTFYQGAEGLAPWQRVRRIGVPTRLSVDHLMASSAIPFLFAAVKIGPEYFGDGTMRQITSPVGPALHLGADRLLVIGVRHRAAESPAPASADSYPTLARIAGHVLNTLFLDSLDTDLERLRRINRTIALLGSQVLQENGIHLRKIDTLQISPSQDLGEIAGQHQRALPRTLRMLLKGIGGSTREGADLVSYLLFEKDYCRELIALGYADTIDRREELLPFLMPTRAGEPSTAAVS